MLGSRTAVKIDQYNGRLPDILFVRADNTAIVHKDAIYGAPDVVIEIVSPNDSRSDLISLEADYRAVGVSEIVFVDPQRKLVTLLERSETDAYTATTLTTGRLELRSIPGFWVEVEWIFAEIQPDEFEVTSRLIQESESVGI